MEGFFEGLRDVNEAMFWNYNHILDVFKPQRVGVFFGL